jgi:hypothetical protein
LCPWLSTDTPTIRPGIARFIASRQAMKAACGPAVAQRHAEALRRAHGDIGIHRAGLPDQRQRQQDRRHDRHRLLGMERRDGVGEIAQVPVGAGILENRSEHRCRVERLGRADDDLDAQRFGPGAHHRDVLRMTVFVHEEPARLGLGHALGHHHRLGAGRGLVEKRGIGDRQACQVRHHRLEVQKRLQPALRDLGLVGRVGGIPGRVLQHVALDRGRRMRAVIPLADHLHHRPVPPAIPRICASSSASDIGAQSSARSCRIEAGTVSSISASRLSTPTTSSISAISAGEGPIWRRLAKSVGS